jgi:hypothetical protein
MEKEFLLSSSICLYLLDSSCYYHKLLLEQRLIFPLGVYLRIMGKYLYYLEEISLVRDLGSRKSGSLLCKLGFISCIIQIEVFFF